MFLRKNIQDKVSVYPSIGQKKLNAASVRLMVYFWTLLASDIAKRWPCDLYRLTRLHCIPERACRWLDCAYAALSSMATVCAEGGRYLSETAVASLEKNYMAYREAYNCNAVAL